METTPPRPDEFEISLFGPGKGECVVIHLGNNDWCVVDSCVARGKTDSVAVEYLAGFNNDALRNVRLVIASHWHDDHIGGMGSLLSQAPNAVFSCSVALEHPEFLTLISAANENVAGSSGVEEFAKILKVLEPRERTTPIFAVENRVLLSVSDANSSFPITLRSLSPSDRTLFLALSQIKGFLPQVGQPQRRIIAPYPNHASVVIWVVAGPIRALLGADLEHTRRSDQGWTAVLACHSDNPPASFFKVPHHGSPTSDNADVWTRMLDTNPIAVLTPYSPARLPRNSDLKRLCRRTASLYCTAMGSGQPPKRDPSVEKAMKRQLSERRIISGRPGHVRVRWSTNGEKPVAQIETFNGAYHVNPAILKSTPPD